MARTVFICVVLALSSVLFSKDANDLLLGPIEDMIEKVKKIQLNPLEAAANEEREAVTRELALQENPDLASTQTKKKGGEGPMETVILEQTIIKIGALLALGFGEAGSEIIATNMRRAGGEVDPMIPGKKTYCIFGFCDIRQFTDTTEVLQEKVMVFVNRIAEVVHTIVDQYSGNANKNIGDAFLLVWKYPEEVLQYNTTHSSPGRNHPFMENLADMSLISFLKIQAAINTNPKIIKYRNNTKLQAGVPGFSVKMGFGLHFGWAIEGAIGSEFKIDASYLSPNVNMASRLEAATKQYGVPLLVSGQLYNILSHDVKQHLRLLDVVKVKGSEQDTRLYTCDIDPTVLQPATNSVSEYKDKKHKRVLQRIARDELRHKAYLGTFKISTLFQEDDELKLMRSTISAAFISKFAQGVEAYIQGDWEHAKTILIEVNEMKPDGPTNTLLEVIEEFGGRAPPDWKGSRYLTEK